MEKFKDIVNIKTMKKLIIFFIGMSVIQLGVALFLKTNIGSDPFTVFTQGLANTLTKFGLDATPGMANRIILILLFSVILIVNKSHIKIGTLICVVGVGPIIDLGMTIVSIFQVESCGFIFKMIFLTIGCFVIAVGFSMLSATNIGVAPNDIIPFIIKEKTNFQYRWIRIFLDASFLIGGYFLGGTIGVGTVIAMLTTGPFIQMCLPYGKKFVDFLIEEKIELDDLEEVK